MSATSGSDWSAGLRRGDPAELEAWLAFALDCCDLADAIALDAIRSELTIEAKADGTFVTDADRGIERAIRSRIADRFPDHGIVGEEYGTDADLASVRWYLDPIDGTHNFMRGIPIFGTLLAVERDGELQAGVVSAPALGQRWWARRGGGAWTAGGARGARRPLAVSTQTELAPSQVLYGSINDLRESRIAAGFDALLRGVWRERGLGDFWGYMLVADGAAEVMVEQGLQTWDLAAPAIIVEEAGGRVTDFGGVRTIGHREALATNGLLHDAVVAGLAASPDPG